MSIQGWVNERFDMQPVIRFMEKKKVPAGPGWFWYYMGGVALFLFVVQVITGILLLMYYKASASEAFLFLTVSVRETSETGTRAPTITPANTASENWIIDLQMILHSSMESTR